VEGWGGALKKKKSRFWGRGEEGLVTKCSTGIGGGVGGTDCTALDSYYPRDGKRVAESSGGFKQKELGEKNFPDRSNLWKVMRNGSRKGPDFGGGGASGRRGEIRRVLYRQKDYL